MQPVFYAAEINKEFVIKMTNSPTVRRRLNNTRSMPRVVIPLHLARVGIPAHRAKNSNIAKLQTGLRSPAGPRRRRKRTHAMRRASASSGCSFGDDFASSTKPRCGQGRGPLVSLCKRLYAILRAKPMGVPTFTHESERGTFGDNCAKTIFCRVILIDGSMEAGKGCL